MRARLADARHFWQTDLAPLPDARDKTAKPLDQRLAKLERVVFHEKLGTQGERVERIEALARELAPRVLADPGLAARAAHLAKADLATEMVGEFPELQGLMGRYYALAQGEERSVADAIEEHWKPQGPNDRIPTAPVSIAVALADKLDTLAGFWAIDEKPTGSKDPYALQTRGAGRDPDRAGERAAAAADAATLTVSAMSTVEIRHRDGALALMTRDDARDSHGVTQSVVDAMDRLDFASRLPRMQRSQPSLLAFFADRLKVYLRDKGARHDLIDAVFALPGQDDLLMIVRRVEALGRFLDAEDGRNLLAGYRRAANILRAEEKKRRRRRLRRPARSGAPRPAGRKGPRRHARRGRRGGARTGDPRGFRGRHAGARDLARAGRRFFPRRHRQRRRPGFAAEPSQAPQRIARGDAWRRGFLQGRRIARRL